MALVCHVTATQQHLTAGGSVSGLDSRRPNRVGFSSAIDGPPVGASMSTQESLLPLVFN